MEPSPTHENDFTHANAWEREREGARAIEAVTYSGSPSVRPSAVRRAAEAVARAQKSIEREVREVAAWRVESKDLNPL